MRKVYRAPLLGVLLTAGCAAPRKPVRSELLQVRVTEIDSPGRAADDPAIRGDPNPPPLPRDPALVHTLKEENAVWRQTQWQPEAGFDLPARSSHELKVHSDQRSLLIVRTDWSGDARAVRVSVKMGANTLATANNEPAGTGHTAASTAVQVPASSDLVVMVQNSGTGVVKVRAIVGILALPAMQHQAPGEHP